MMKALKDLSILIVIIFMGCSKNDKGQMNLSEGGADVTLKHLEWIVGTWQRESSRGAVYDNWKTVNDTLWRGKAYRLAKKDTVILETLSLQVKDDEMFYVAVLPNNPGPLHFKMVELSGSKVVFENPEHDFPRRIIYQKISDDSLHARIEGLSVGVETSADFHFRRVTY